MAGEIISLQFGHRSNFVATHFWNIQDAFASQFPNADVDVNVLFREETEKRRGSVEKRIYSPRTLIFDLKGSLGAMGSGGYKTKKLFSGPAPGWNAQVDVVTRRRQKNRFLRAVDDAYDQQDYDEVQLRNSEASKLSGAAALLAKLTRRPGQDADEESSAPSSGPLERKKNQLAELKEQEETIRRIHDLDVSEGADASQSKAELEELHAQIKELEYDIRRLELVSKERSGEAVPEAEKYNFGLDDSVQVWSDFCKVNIHPNSICILDAFDHEFDAFDIWAQGPVALPKPALEEYMDTNIRRWAEECDRLRGFHVFVDAALAWGNVCDSFLEDIRQEYGKKSIFSFADVQQPVPPASKEVMEKNFNLASNYRDSVERSLLNTSFSMQALREKSDLVVPYSYSHLEGRFPHLNLDVKKRFHTSALIASALDNVTMPYRFVDSPNSITSLVSNLAPVRSLNVSSLSLSAPLPLGLEKTLLLDVLKKDTPLYRAPFMVSMLEHMYDPSKHEHQTPFAESAFLRGVPEWARRPAGSAPNREVQCPPTVLLMLQYMSAYQCRYRNFLAMDEASAAPISFPRFFKPHLSRGGFLDAPPPPGSTEQALLRSFPSLSHVQTTTHLRGWYRTMGRNLSQLDWHRLAPLYDGTLHKSSFDELGNEWHTLSEDYEWHG